MDAKARLREEALRLYESTGDKAYQRLADSLAPRRPRRRPKGGGRAEHAAPLRIMRMNEMWLRDEVATPTAAARREVEAWGKGEHGSDVAAITYLRKLYRQSEEATFAWLKGVFGLDKK
jgi:hypothetical protein